MIAGIYVRTSTVRQGEEGTSLETQEEQAKLKATELDYQVDPAYIWRDMESGAFMDRPGLNMMLLAVQNRRVDIVFVYAHDRLSRNPVDLLNIQQVFIDAGVRLEYVRGSSDTSPEGQLMTHFFGYAAGAAPANGTFDARQGTGCQERPHAHYRRCGPLRVRLQPLLAKRTFNETEATVVRMMFQWALEGISVYLIACTLNEKKIPSKTGSLWNHSSVNRILKNQAYTGATYYGRFRHRSMKRGKKEITKRPDSEAILVEGFTPQLITTGYFQAVQERLATRSGRWKGKGPHYMMTGFTKCGKCGSAVVGNMQAGGHLYYRCISTRSKAEGPATCHARNIRADRPEGVVWEMVSEAIRHPKILSQEVQRHAQTGDGNLGERMTRLHSEIVDLKNQQRRLIEQRQKDVIDQGILESQIAPVKLLCEDKVGQLSALEDQQKSKDAVVHAEERIAEYCRRLAEGLDNLDQEGKRATFAAFGVKVEATREDLSVVLEIDPGVTIIYPSS